MNSPTEIEVRTLMLKRIKDLENKIEELEDMRDIAQQRNINLN